MLSKYFPYIVIFLLLIGFYYFNAYRQQQISILKQNNSALGDTLTLYSTDNANLYEKLAYIEAIADSHLNKNISLQEKTTILTRQVVSLEKIITNTIGTTDTIIKEECEGIVLRFSDSTAFYSYVDSIWVNNPPRQKFAMKFKPFSIKNFVGINADNKINSIIELKGWAKDFVSIFEIETIVDPSIYSKFGQLSESSLSFFIIGGLQTQPEVYLKGGAGILSNSNLFIYNYGSNSSHELLYGREFSLWK